MRRVLACLTLLAFLWVPGAARAQGEVQFDTVLVQLWPEFDKPDMLVMLQFTLDPAVALPRDMQFRLPASANLQAVAVGATQAQVTDQDIASSTRQDGDWTWLTITAVSGPAIRIEYYDTLEIDGARRHYFYQWMGDQAVADLAVIVQQPVDATNLALVPPSTRSTTDTNGLSYYQVEFSSLPAGQGATLDVSYLKTTDRLSASLPEVQPAVPLGSDAQGRISFASYLPWLVGAAGFLLISVGLGIGLSYWRGASKGNGSRKRHEPGSPGKQGSDSVLNCPECGRRLQPGDQFCRACGTRLQSEE